MQIRLLNTNDRAKHCVYIHTLIVQYTCAVIYPLGHPLRPFEEFTCITNSLPPNVGK